MPLARCIVARLTLGYDRFSLETKKARLKRPTFDNVRSSVRPILKMEIYLASVFKQRVQTYLRTLWLPSIIVVR